MQAQEKGFTEPSNCDGLLEVVAFKSGYHAGVVMAGGMHAVRLAQVAGVRMHVRGTEATKGGGQGMGTAYIQLDGEPWKQNVPGKQAPESEALQVCMLQLHTLLLNFSPDEVMPLPSSVAASHEPCQLALDLPGFCGTCRWTEQVSFAWTEFSI